MLRFYGPILRRAFWVVIQAAKQHNDIKDIVVLLALSLVFLLPGAAISGVSKWAPDMSPLLDWWPHMSLALLLGLIVYGVARANYERFCAVEAAGERAVQELRNELIAAQAEAHSKIEALSRQLAPFIELRPLIIEAVEPDANFRRLVVRNPNPKPVPDCQVRLVTITRTPPDPGGAALPPPGFTFPQSSHSGASLDYPIPPGAPVHVDIAAHELNPVGRLFFPSFSHGTPDQPIRPMFPQNAGIFGLVLEAGSKTAVIEPTTARVSLIFDRTPVSLTAVLLDA